MLIEQDQQLSLAFFLKQLGVQTTAARSQAPVEAANIVTGLVSARFGVVHPTAV
jgi:hypothetical protein